MVMEVIEVCYQGDSIGALSFDSSTGLGAFEYTPEFIKKGIQLSPLKMPLSPHIYRFPELDYQTFKGLPGLIADSLPDDFGNAVMNAWVSSQGKSVDSITPLQRLQYTGKRGMGALDTSLLQNFIPVISNPTFRLNLLLLSHRRFSIYVAIFIWN